MEKSYELIKRFKRSIVEESRYFVDDDITDVFSSVINNKKYKIKKETPFYRGRVHKSNQRNKYRKDKMYAPPKNVMTHGRFNPYGINYLYLATDIETVIAELRPDINSKLTIGKFVAKDDFKLVSCRRN